MTRGATVRSSVATRRATARRFAMALAAFAIALLAPSKHAFAAVYTTSNPSADADAVYVAGNPSWYPLEYYNEKTREYEGVLPSVLELVSERTDLDFAYVRAGNEDRREQLAENGQVDMVSGCALDEGWLDAPNGDEGAATRRSGVIVRVPATDGISTRSTDACIAFTFIADEHMVRRIEGALEGMDGSELAGATVAYVAEHPTRIDGRVVAAVATVVVLLAVLAFTQHMKISRYKHATMRSANLDSLTSIWNKTYLVEYYRERISEQNRVLYCMVYIGFDITRVNQYYGEDAAEEQLCFAASELQKHIRDREVAARVSGGGLAVLHRTGDVTEAVAWAGRVLDHLNAYNERYGRDYRPNFRAGVYMLQHGDHDCDVVLNNARRGYLQAAEDNVLCAVVGQKQLKLEAERLQLKKSALDALRQRQFKMFLQFVVDAKDESIRGAEAVSRWDHPRRGLLYPGSYIDIMESEGTIAELDFYIFEEACRQLERWCGEGRAITISCNFSRITICREDFVRRVTEVSKRFRFDRRLLVMEITEAVMESNREMAFDNVMRCKELGFQIALDDTGEGHTSFSDLRDYPLDVVKVDRSIVVAAVTPRGAALLRGVIALVHSLGMEALCEGAETREQVELLREVDCDYIQGYFYYRPLPLAEAERVLAEQLG